MSIAYTHALEGYGKPLLHILALTNRFCKASFRPVPLPFGAPGQIIDCLQEVVLFSTS